MNIIFLFAALPSHQGLKVLGVEHVEEHDEDDADEDEDYCIQMFLLLVKSTGCCDIIHHERICPLFELFYWTFCFVCTDRNFLRFSIV